MSEPRFVELTPEQQDQLANYESLAACLDFSVTRIQQLRADLRQAKADLETCMGSVSKELAQQIVAANRLCEAALYPCDTCNHEVSGPCGSRQDVVEAANQYMVARDRERRSKE